MYFSPSVFFQSFNSIIADLDGIKAYQDDAVVHVPTRKIPDFRSCCQLGRSIQFNIAITSCRCVFNVDQVCYLEYKISSAKRLTLLADIPYPDIVHSLCSISDVYNNAYDLLLKLSNKPAVSLKFFLAGAFVGLLFMKGHCGILLQSDILLEPFSPNDPSVVSTDVFSHISATNWATRGLRLREG